MPWVWPITKGIANLSRPLETTTSTSVRDSTRSPAAGLVAITLPSGISWLFWRTTRTSNPDSWIEEKASVSHLPTTSGMATITTPGSGSGACNSDQTTQLRPARAATNTKTPTTNGRGTGRRSCMGG